jgi:plastocyanin
VIILFPIILALGGLPESNGQVSSSASLAQVTFPPPLFYKLRDEPSYAIRIPFSENGHPSFVPSTISIPSNFTVIWFNDDVGTHTVTSLPNSSYSMPEKFDSNIILPNGGSFIHKFTKPGIYDYYDKMNPTAVGRIKVGDEVEYRQDMDLLIGGVHALPFSANLSRLVLSFVPTNITIPPLISMTYNVTISNSTAKLFSHLYEDIDGILDLELVPATQLSNTTRNVSHQFTTWGPDFISEEGRGSTGTFHIQGPVLTNNKDTYYIMVGIIAKDNKIFSKPIFDQFILPSTQTMAFKLTNPFEGPLVPEKQPSTVANSIPTGNYTISTFRR